MTTSEAINEIGAALAKAQRAIEGAKKASVNPAFKSADKPRGSQYADLGAVWDACREQLTSNGIAVLQPPGKHADGTLCTFTRLVHSSGQWMQDDGVPLILGKNDMQGLGSAMTYSRRYGLMAMVGIAPEDDDGNAASAGNGKTVAAPVPNVPDGYMAWRGVLEAVALNGLDALREAWKTSPEPFRNYLTTYDAAAYDQMKKRGDAATKKAAKQPAHVVPA